MHIWPRVGSNRPLPYVRSSVEWALFGERELHDLTYCKADR